MVDVLANDEWRIIVPVRFERFNHGRLPTINSPDIDDRGYAKGARPGAWGDTSVRGPSFGVLVGDTVHVRVYREDIDADAPLVARSSDEKVLAIATPAGIIDRGGDLEVHGVASGTARIEIRLGDHEGPVIGEADVRVHARLRLALTPHLVRIDSSTATGTRPVADIDRMIRLVRAIWRPCGVDFNVRATVNDSTILPSNRVDFLDFDSPRWQTEIRALLGLQRLRLGLADDVRDESINWYIIQEFVAAADGSAVAGVGVSRDTADGWGTDTGVVASARSFGNPRDPDNTARNLAHEIGHFLRLAHAHDRDADNPAPDTFSRRQLMYPLTLIQGGTNGFALPRFNDVGCGPGVAGCLITMKQHRHHSTDGECATARNAIHAGNWF